MSNYLCYTFTPLGMSHMYVPQPALGIYDVRRCKGSLSYFSIADLAHSVWVIIFLSCDQLTYKYSYLSLEYLDNKNIECIDIIYNFQLSWRDLRIDWLLRK